MLSIDIVLNNPEYYFNSHVQSYSRLVWHLNKEPKLPFQY